MTVIATCRDCRHEHALGDRDYNDEIGTTECPSCESTQYDSQPSGDTQLAPEVERIETAVSDIRGVGDETLTNIQETFGFYVELEAAGVDTLTDIDGVGPKTAERIQEAV